MFLVNPHTQKPLKILPEQLLDEEGNVFPKINGVYRFVKQENYTQNFGFQWKEFQKTQIDRHSGNEQSRERFFTVTHWDQEDLKGKNILEVGSGAGRFSQVVLDYTEANLYSIDYSEAVEVNFKNNGQHQDRLHLFQASIYEMPFQPGSFDKVFCFGVLQHTPDVKRSVQSLIKMLKPGAELVVDFYPIRGFWTKLHAKYLFRPFLKKMKHKNLLKLIEWNIGWMIALSRFFTKIGLGRVLNRFIPICDIENTFPENLAKEQLREWAILDTFDMFSPEYDQPQKLSTVKKWFEEAGMQKVEASYISYGKGSIAVVKGIK